MRWFKAYNKRKPYRAQVRPFGFMLAFTANRLMDMARAAHAPLVANAKKKIGRPKSRQMAHDAPRAVAPYNRDLQNAVKHCFDRDTGKPVSAKCLKTYAQALLRYHLHPEAKFLGGEYVDRGLTRRRHIQVTEIQRIGKEANRWEEQFYLGGDPEAQAEYGISPEEQERATDEIREAVRGFGQRKLAKEARVSRNTLVRALKINSVLCVGLTLKLMRAIERLNAKVENRFQ